MTPKKKIAICSRNIEGKVVSQNEHSYSLCGNQVGNKCTQGCVDFYTECERPVLQKRKLVQNKYFDLVFYKNDEENVTLLHPLEEGNEDLEKRLTEAELTPREMEIALLIRKGFSNQEIAKKLFISKSTLKTHINRVYKKLPEASQLLKRSSSE